jgi:hypothetical protein
MTRDDRPEDPPGEGVRDEDPDRAAILARRRRFVAIALSGLAAGTGCTPKPEPCLSVAPLDDPSSGGKPEAPPEPMPCLKVAPPEPDPVPEQAPVEPEPCLKVKPPDEPKPEPRPCLKVRAPDRPPEPQPCLSVARPDPPPDTKPKPAPCLKVARPGG